MTEAQSHLDSNLNPLPECTVGVGNHEIVRSITTGEEVDVARSEGRASVRRALNLAGAWKHLDDEDGPDVLDELDRMRHETKPTPPFEL